MLFTCYHSYKNLGDIIFDFKGERDSSVGKSFVSQVGDPGSNPSEGLDSGHPMHE